MDRRDEQYERSRRVFTLAEIRVIRTHRIGEVQRIEALHRASLSNVAHQGWPKRVGD